MPKPKKPPLPWRERHTVTPAQAQEILSVGKTKLFEMLKNGELESVAAGRRRLVRVESMMRLGRAG
jgi:excisionase family DNA binding protein